VQDPHQPQQPPPQQPPPLGALGIDDADPVPLERPVIATVRSSRTVSEWPDGQGAGSSMFAIERVTSKVSPQERQRTS
jgi:hypothetical protein